MNIIYVVCPTAIEEKLESKHSLSLYEARHALLNHPRIRFAEKGYVEGNDIYAAFGQTLGGRYIAVFFIYKPETATAIIISARDMNAKERRAYGRK